MREYSFAHLRSVLWLLPALRLGGPRYRQLLPRKQQMVSLGNEMGRGL
jgi:hypothetical protein